MSCIFWSVTHDVSFKTHAKWCEAFSHICLVEALEWLLQNFNVCLSIVVQFRKICSSIVKMFTRLFFFHVVINNELMTPENHYFLQHCLKIYIFAFATKMKIKNGAEHSLAVWLVEAPLQNFNVCLGIVVRFRKSSSENLFGYF